MKRYWILAAPVLAGAGLVFGAGRETSAVDPARYIDHVRYLASPKLKGRGAGTPGLEKAAGYIAKQFADAGLEPLGDSGYLQWFPVTTSAGLGKKNQLRVHLPSGVKQARAQTDFIPMNFSSSGKYSGGVVFAGYGITAREYGYDDYTHLDVKDKFVIVLRHEPQEFEDKSVFAGKVYTEHSQFFSKASNAKFHGARGVLFVNDQPAHQGGADDLEGFVKTAGPGNAGIPFVQVKAEMVDQWLAVAGKNLKQIHESIDKDLEPQSFPLPEVQVELEVDVRREQKRVSNVIGYIPGETDEYVVVGAHHDHLGLGEQFSMAPSQAGTAHPGADDNASGTAGVIELARSFGAARRAGAKLRRGVVFMTFAAEELGLLGSSYFVNNPRLPIEKAAAMINMDMIGRIRDGKVYLGGLGTGEGFEAMMRELQASAPSLKFEFSEQGGYGSSDHTSFTTKQVPVLFFFSGLHGDYHKPSDTWEKIQAGPAVDLLRVVGQAMDRLADAPERPKFVKVTPPARPVSAGSGSSSGYGAYFGSIPDFAEPPKGVRFSDVREGSPAAKAGLKAGDILIEFDGKPVGNLQDFTYLLRQGKPGDTITVKVLREGAEVAAPVTLERRK